MQRTASLQRRSLDFGSAGASYGYSRDGGTPTFQGFKAGPGAASGGGGGGTPRHQECDSNSDDDDVNEASLLHLPLLHQGLPGIECASSQVSLVTSGERRTLSLHGWMSSPRKRQLVHVLSCMLFQPAGQAQPPPLCF